MLNKLGIHELRYLIIILIVACLTLIIKVCKTTPLPFLKFTFYSLLPIFCFVTFHNAVVIYKEDPFASDSLCF